jgi:hypothetical protein
MFRNPILLFLIGFFFWLERFMLYANHKGSEGVVHVGTSAIAELKGYEINEQGNVINDTILSDTWETNQVGNKSWSGSATAHYDETDTNAQEVLVVGSKVTLKFYPEGVATLSTYKLGTAVVTGVRTGAAINGMVEKDFTFTGDGALTQTTV